ncbi:MAG: hypothetical protein CM15mP42_08950 [Methanobacteriota archaeon]|nr:MAG: hypothetical protein CM15mP42_08950 [Euryarchaeota archaeon]
MIFLVGKRALKKLGFPKVLASPGITKGEKLVGVSLEDRVPLEVASRAGERPFILFMVIVMLEYLMKHLKNFTTKL